MTTGNFLIYNIMTAVLLFGCIRIFLRLLANRFLPTTCIRRATASWLWSL